MISETNLQFGYSVCVCGRKDFTMTSSSVIDSKPGRMVVYAWDLCRAAGRFCCSVTLRGFAWLFVVRRLLLLHLLLDAILPILLLLFQMKSGKVFFLLVCSALYAQCELLLFCEYKYENYTNKGHIFFENSRGKLESMPHAPNSNDYTR